MDSPFLTRDLCVAPIGAYIDPPRPQDRAIITHGHADHARSGHGAVLATPDTIAIMKTRYGEDCAGRFEPLPFGETRLIDGVTVTPPPGGAHPRLGAGAAASTRGSASSSPATTSGSATARRSRSNWCRATCS